MSDGITRRSLLAGIAAGTLASSAHAAGQAGRSQGAGPANSPADPTRLTIDEARTLIASRKLSPVELTKAYLARIEKFNPRVNAYITVMADAALSQARALEDEIAKGRTRGPLHGIPIGLKDNIDTAGVRTTAASAVYADRIPTEDAPVVRKLRDAGAVFLGKLNMHEFAYGGTSVVSHFGPVRNPWNVDYSPGGSSGGSGAAVAARLCAAALGTDTAASVRVPAAFCGVVGLKATHGLASIRGIVPLSETHDHVGPLSRRVVDSALVMTAISGFDPLDPMSITAEPVNYREAIGGPVAKLRIGIPRQPFFADLDPEIAAAVDAAIGVLKKLTASVADVEVPAVNTFPSLLGDIYVYHAAMVADEKRAKLYQPVTLQRILDGQKIPLPAYVESRRQMHIGRNRVPEIFARVDVLVTPTTMRMPPTIASVLAEPTSELTLIRNTVPFNSLGMPTISVPCGFTKGGLPIGLQISGPRFAESRVLALAHAYEQATAWHRREPPLA
jgi:aspartyl-tRNA(Asn)/glutamyl-tRNA(Gln) amidotransferase subunit A